LNLQDDVYDVHRETGAHPSGQERASLGQTMRVLVITQLWPNGVEPRSAPFNLQQMKCLARTCDVSVLAALAYLPGATHLPDRVRPPRARALAELPARESIEGVDTHYMRQLYVPKVGVPVAVPLYLASLAPHRALLARADVILGTWAYPDGCAAILAARALGKPCAVKVHGSDINQLAKRPSARAVLTRVLPRADALVSVSQPLSAELEALGVARSKIHLVPNGVDTAVFAPRDRREARRALGLPETAPVVVFVGRLEEPKGVAELLEAIPKVRARVPGVVFGLIGSGALAGRAKELGVVAPGARPLKEVAEWLAACDVFTLPSWMEGTPNVVLEALASGRPVVATRVGGIPDVVPEPEAGELVPPRDPGALAEALVRVLERGARGEWNAERLRALGPKTWSESARALLDVLEGIQRG
jgi:glycosyltransferase involved in cell wall biosynthesis